MRAKIIKVNPDFPEKELIKESAEVLKKGGLVAFPTETVYGLGANFLDPRAIKKLYKIKRRPRGKPFTIQVAQFEALEDLGIEVSRDVSKLIHKFWPGPLTIVAYNKDKEKIGIRIPRNKIALDLIKDSGVPIAVSSANVSGKKPPVSGEAVISEIGSFIDLIIDGGKVEIGVESTVLDVTMQPFTILREGAISKEDLLADYHILFVCTGNSCRSVIARAILEKFLRQAGLSNRVQVDSAGIGAYPGTSAAVNTVEVLKREGIDVSMHKAKRVSPDLLRKADLIFVMENRERDVVLRCLSEAGLKLRLLKEDGDISDPIGKPIEEYKVVLNIIKDEVENIFLELFKKESKYEDSDRC